MNRIIKYQNNCRQMNAIKRNQIENNKNLPPIPTKTNQEKQNTITKLNFSPNSLYEKSLRDPSLCLTPREINNEKQYLRSPESDDEIDLDNFSTEIEDLMQFL
ncbi:Hypothetical_protein [Hexamita inflata]|uniref:Hypothetical_protein n=1 Tax=Hexamita inflata TaxID=28002 RepID=A0AA86PAK1_9EUKA|nr:Hypothetical protein HINF_LOCUS20439 [Hexamita inflata]